MRLKIRSSQDFAAGILFAVAGIGFALGSMQYDFGAPSRPGPAYFPFGLGVLLTLLGLGVLASALSLDHRAADRAPIAPPPWRALIGVIGSVAVFGWLLPRAGLLIALPLLVAGCSATAPGHRWRTTLLVAAALTGLCWLLFVCGLGLDIPVWPLH